MTVYHWTPPDALGDILRQAWRPDVAEPIAIHVRTTVQHRMLQQMTPAVRAACLERGSIGQPYGLPLVIDDRIPWFPGFEIHRKPPVPRPCRGE
jgi:thiamine monophosphate synthase